MQRFHYCLLCAGSVLLIRSRGTCFLKRRSGLEQMLSTQIMTASMKAGRGMIFLSSHNSPPNISRSTITLAIARRCRGRSGLTIDDLGILLRGEVLDYDRLITRVFRGRRVEHLLFMLFHLPRSARHSRTTCRRSSTAGPVLPS